jgi:hypothetical protein
VAVEMDNFEVAEGSEGLIRWVKDHGERAAAVESAKARSGSRAGRSVIGDGSVRKAGAAHPPS